MRGGEAKGSPAGDTYPAALPPGLRAERPRRPRSVSDNGPERPRRHIRGRGGGKAGTRRGSQRGPAGKRLLPPPSWRVYVRAGGGSIPRSSRPGPAEGKRLFLTGSPPVAAEGPGRRSREVGGGLCPTPLPRDSDGRQREVTRGVRGGSFFPLCFPFLSRKQAGTTINFTQAPRDVCFVC